MQQDHTLLKELRCKLIATKPSKKADETKRISTATELLPRPRNTRDAMKVTHDAILQPMPVWIANFFESVGEICTQSGNHCRIRDQHDLNKF